MFVLIRGCWNIPKRRCWGGGGWTCQMAGTYSFVVVTTTLSALTPPSTPPATTSHHPATTAEILLLLRPAAAPPPPHPPPPHNKKWRSQPAVRSRPFCLSGLPVRSTSAGCVEGRGTCPYLIPTVRSPMCPEVSILSLRQSCPGVRPCGSCPTSH